MVTTDSARPPVSILLKTLSGRMNNGFNRGLAAMPGQERSLRIDAQDPDGDLFDNQRQHERQWQGISRPKR